MKNTYSIITKETSSFSKAKSILDTDNNKVLLKEYLTQNLKPRPNVSNLSQATKKKSAGDVDVVNDIGVKLEDVLKICDLLGLRQEEGIARYQLPFIDKLLRGTA